mgnify:CR=1 FL=1
MENNGPMNDVRLDIEAVDFELSETQRQIIMEALGKLRRYYSGDVITAEVYMRQEAHGGPNDKSLRIKYGVPGNDVVADDTGENWGTLANSVTAKLRKQLEKRFGNSMNRNRGTIDEIDPADLAV